MNNIIKDQRRIIAKEIELGFLRIPPKTKKYFPEDNQEIDFIIDGRSKKLHFNSAHGRIFGLVNFFRQHEATPNDVVEFEINEDGGKIKLTFHKFDEREKDLSSIDDEEASEIVNISDLSSQAKGNIVEQRVAELILLYGQGLLNVYKPIADIEGIDLVVLKKGVFQPIFIQVKSRFNLRNNQLQIGIKKNGFNPHHTFFVVGAYFDARKVDIHDYLVFIPTVEFQKKSVLVRKDSNDALHVLNTRLSGETNGKYSDYIIKKENLVNKIFEKFVEIEKYLR